MDAETPAPMSVSRRVASGTGWVVGWRLVSRNLGLLSTLILVRLLRPEDFGLVTIATGFATVVDSLSAIGVQDALVRAAAPDRDMYDTAFTLNLIRGILTALILFAIAWPTADFFHEPRLFYVMLALGASMLLSAFSNIKVVDFRRDFQFQKEFNLNMVSRVVMIVSTVAAAWIWRSYWALVFGLLMMRIAGLAQSYIMAPYWPRWTLRAWRGLFGFSFWTWCQTMVSQIKERGDSVIIGRILGTTEFGVFSIGLELGALPVTEVVEPLGRTLFSGFALLHRDEASPTKLYLGAVEFAMMLVLPAGLGISMVADPMVRFVMGTQWLSAVPVIQITAIASAVSIFGCFSGSFLIAGGKVRDSFLVALASGAIRLPVMIALVYGWGLTGAAVAAAILLVIEQGLFLWRTMDRLEIKVRDLLARTWRSMAASAVMVICMWYLGFGWSMGGDFPGRSNGQDLMLRCTTGAAIYGVALGLAWLLAGRPDSIERKVLMLVWQRLGRRRARS